MNAGDAVVDALAVCRITRLISKDTLFDTPREALLNRLEDGGPVARKAAEGIVCPWCVSMYVALIVVAARCRLPRAWGPLAKVLAASHIAGLAANVDVD